MYSTDKRTINSEEETYTCTVDQHIKNGEKKQVWQLGHHHSYKHCIVTDLLPGRRNHRKLETQWRENFKLRYHKANLLIPEALCL